MPIGRIILKSISESRKVSDLKTDGARLLYTWLLTHLDINGCYSGDPQVINGKIFTRLKKSIKTIENYLIDLEQNNLIIRYQVDGDIFLNVPDFIEKQPSLNPSREGKTNIPVPTPDILQSKPRGTPTQDKLSKDKISKDKYKDYVFLSKEEYQKLLKKLGEEKTKNWIKELNGYIGQIGIKKAEAKYSSHYHVILNWINKDKKNGKSKINISDINLEE